MPSRLMPVGIFDLMQMDQKQGTKILEYNGVRIFIENDGSECGVIQAVIPCTVLNDIGLVSKACVSSSGDSIIYNQDVKEGGFDGYDVSVARVSKRTLLTVIPR